VNFVHLYTGIVLTVSVGTLYMHLVAHFHMQWICYTHNGENIHYPKVLIQPPVLHAVLGNFNPLFLNQKRSDVRKCKG
jgi:hypothetical protein